MMGELFTIRGEVSGTGVMTIRGDIIYGTANSIRLLKGNKLKIWCKRLCSDAPATLEIQYTEDITIASPTWVTLSREYLSSAGEITLEKNRPQILRSITGKEGVRLYHTGTGTCSVDLEVEITKEE
jgi:hypothetical protein